VTLLPGQIPGEGQVQLRQGYKEEPVSHFVLACSLAGLSACLHPLDKEKIALSGFSVSCVSVFSTGGSLIPTGGREAGKGGMRVYSCLPQYTVGGRTMVYAT
jgi:hypothetical protein